MTQLLSFLLSALLLYGYPIIIGVIILGALAIPVPASTLLLAAGSFLVSGNLNAYVLVPVVIVTAVCGDIVGYILGKRFGIVVLTKYFSKIGTSFSSIESAQILLSEWGIWALFLTRWLITPLGVPLNIIAGITEYSFVKFVAIVVIGESLWGGMYLYLGYIFGANWQSIVDYIGDAPTILTLVFVSILLVFIAFKLRRK